ncbi:hypothetical protein SBADM41S_06101 [Streptomyces badius]
MPNLPRAPMPTGRLLRPSTYGSPTTCAVAAWSAASRRSRRSLGALSLTLQHFFRTDDLLIGYPAVDWRRSRYPGVVGLFSEMLPFRPPTRQGGTVDDYLGRVQDSVLECLAHQGGSLEKAWATVRSAAVDRALSGSSPPSCRSTRRPPTRRCACPASPSW